MQEENNRPSNTMKELNVQTSNTEDIKLGNKLRAELLKKYKRAYFRYPGFMLSYKWVKNQNQIKHAYS